MALCCPVSTAAAPGFAAAKKSSPIITLTSRMRRSPSARCSGVPAVLTIELERMERVFALAGQASAEDLEIYARVAGNLRRLLEAVGLQRRAKDITKPPSVSEYLEHVAAQEAT